MIPSLETVLPEETFDPKHNIHLAEVIAYLGLLKENGNDNGYRAGVVTKTIFGQLIDFGFQYNQGEIIIFKECGNKSETLIVGKMPDMYNGIKPVNRNKLLEPLRPFERVPKDYIREVI